MLKQLTIAIATASALTATMVSAETVGSFDVSMNASLTTDYIWRGISQTSGDGAIQGGLDVAHDSGLYAGIWASNVNFAGGSEFDYYVGFGGDITEDFSYDIGYNTYTYPGDSSWNFAETYGSISGYGFTVGAAYSSDMADNDSTLYTYLGYEYSLPMDIGLALQVGEYDFKDAAFASGDEEYNDWSIGLTKEYVGLEFGLTYTDTNVSSSDCAAFAGSSDYCNANFVLSVSKSL